MVQVPILVEEQLEEEETIKNFEKKINNKGKPKKTREKHE